MAPNSRPPPNKVWTYAYQVVPPQVETRMRSIKTLLEQEHEDAKRSERKWHGRLVHEHQVTHILVVTDSPDEDLRFNERLEAALAQLDAGFSRTLPLPVEDGAGPDGRPDQG